MKVIKKPSAPLPYHFTCRGCGAELEALPGDVVERGMDRDSNYVVFICPECMHKAWVNPSVLPDGWRNV